MKKSGVLLLIVLAGCFQAPKPPAPGNDPVAKETISLSENPLLSGTNATIEFSDLKAGQATEAAESVIKTSDKIVAELLTIQDSERTFENTMLPLDNIATGLGMVVYPVYLMANVHTDEEIRDECNQIVVKIDNYSVDLTANVDVYEAVMAFSKTPGAVSLTGERKKFLEDSILEFKRIGFGLEKEKRNRVTELQKKLSSLGQTWNKNINTYRDTLFVTEEQISGLPEAYMKERMQEDGTYAIDLSYPSFRPFMRLSNSDEARQMLLKKYLTRASETNMTILDSLIMARHAMATTLGYKTFAEYQTETRMVKTPAVVWEFEKDLQERLKEKALAEYDELLAIKSRETGETAEVINYWENNYYLNKLKIEKYNVDGEIVKQYFEISNVIDGLFLIYQQLLGVKFEQVENPSVWHEDVRMYEAYDEATGTHLGSFYLDLFPRDAKYGHAAMFSVRKGKRLDYGSYLRPVSSLVCNFPKPSEYSQSLLTHDQVETFFHEFGHLMHGLLTTAELWTYSGTAVPRDFVEAPSQMLENWIWNKESLNLFAKHYQTGKAFPEDLLNNMLAAKNVNSGNATLQQVFYGTLDMTLYDGFDPEGDKSTTDVVRDLQNSITMFPYIEATNMQTSFGHLNGYASSYYGYLWSLVIAQDLFSKFEEKGIMSPEQGRQYRDLILAPGGSREPMELIKEYLGRQPDNAAFLRSIGLN